MHYPCWFWAKMSERDIAWTPFWPSPGQWSLPAPSVSSDGTPVIHPDHSVSFHSVSCLYGWILFDIVSESTLLPFSRRPLRWLTLVKLPCDHDVCWYAVTSAFLTLHSVDGVQKAGQWSSSTSFVHHYLVTHLMDSQCVAMCAPSTGASPIVIPLYE